MKFLAKPKQLGFVISPLLSAIIFYLLILLRLKTGEYLEGIRIAFLLLALPFSYLGVVVFGLPSLVIIKRLRLNNIYFWALVGFVNGILTIMLPITIIALVQKANIRKIYGSMLEPILFAGIAATIGILLFKQLEKGEK